MVVLGALRLFGGQFADGGEQRGIDGASIEQESAEHLKDAEFVGGVDEQSAVSGRLANWVLAP
jgi:hypothetical protein